MTVTTFLLMPVVAAAAFAICGFIRGFRHLPDGHGEIISELRIN